MNVTSDFLNMVVYMSVVGYKMNFQYPFIKSGCKKEFVSVVVIFNSIMKKIFFDIDHINDIDIFKNEIINLFNDSK